jgi:hypothetical protein
MQGIEPEVGRVGCRVGGRITARPIIDLILLQSAGFIRNGCQTLFDFCFLGGRNSQNS